MAKPRFTSVDDYIAAQPESARQILQRVRAAIRRALPAAEEGISYQIPTFKVDGRPVIHFAGWQAHYGVYGATRGVVAALKTELAPFQISKGTIRFPLDRPVPVGLITRIARLRAQEARKARARR